MQPRSRTISHRASSGAISSSRITALSRRMSYDAIVVGAGISGASTAYHLAKAGAKTLLIERGEPASGGTGKSAAIIRQSYSTPLLVRLARASITMLGNAKAELGRDAGFVQDGYCFVVNAEMLEGAKKNVAMQRALGIVNEWSEGAGLSAAPARDQPRRYRWHRLRAARRLRRSRAGDRGLRRTPSSARRRIPGAHAGAAALCATATASRASSSTAARCRRTSCQCRRPVGEAARRKRRARPADARGARAGHGVAGAGGARGAEDFGLDGRRRLLLPPARARPLHHRARLSRKSTSTSIPITTRPAPTPTSSPTCRRASSAVSRPSPG